MAEIWPKVAKQNFRPLGPLACSEETFPGWPAGRLKLKLRLTSAQLGLAWLGLSLAIACHGKSGRLAGG